MKRREYMSKVINFEVRKFPATRLIGKQVIMSMSPGPENPAVDLWQSMWQDGCMELLKSLPSLSTEDPDVVGWMGDFNLEDNTLVYIAGVLAQKEALVPDGYIYRDLSECDMGIGWIQGREDGADLNAGAHDKFSLAMKENGYEFDYSAGAYEMEYYSYKRFGVPRYLGEKLLILDYYSPCKKIQAENLNNKAGKNLAGADESKIGKSFNSLAERVIYGYKCTFPDCLPVAEDKVSEISQRHMHGFFREAICSIYKNPSLLNLPTEKDDFFENWEMMNSRPELIESMRKIEIALLNFYGYLYKLGENGEVKDNKLYISSDKMKFLNKRLMQLKQIGLLSESVKGTTIFYCEKYPELFPAWKLLCKTKLVSIKHEIARFIYCMYDVSKYKAEHLFGKITGSSTYIRDLEDYFRDNGYNCLFNDYGIHWERVYPDKQKGKADFFFDWRRRDQMSYIFHVPSFRSALTYFNRMDNDLKDLTFSRTKKCDGCGYCTQMDKSGKRKPLTITLEYNGQKASKCPLFPNLTWRHIDEQEVKIIKKLFNFAVSAVNGSMDG